MTLLIHLLYAYFWLAPVTHGTVISMDPRTSTVTFMDERHKFGTRIVSRMQFNDTHLGDYVEFY